MGIKPEHKGTPFATKQMRRKTYMAIAKSIRNLDISHNNKVKVIRALCKVLEEDNPAYDFVAFKYIALGEDDADEV